MNKETIKRYAKWILEDLKKDEKNVVHWIRALVDVI